MKNFPMFLKMADRRVIIIGGGEEAAQKTRLMMKTDAEIMLITHDPNPELQGYVDQDKIILCNLPITTELFRTAILVFSATGCAGTGAAHAAIAQQSNTIINVVDMPNLCQAMTPSIVDRDPLVVAIGTEGCAPILGRQIKSRIESMLEPRLGVLVRHAGNFRERVAQNIPKENRRRFWNWVFNGSPRIQFSKGDENGALSAIQNMIYASEQKSPTGGQISIVKSQTGALDMIRLRDVAALQEADMIFYQKKMHEPILELARRDAERKSYTDVSQILPRIDQANAKSGMNSQNVAFIVENSNIAM
jgi:uroporphyrin-III C-methyltransferase/precorrin-2 dehydrogenase/sirohydrochlorin ferrochelatase